MSAEPEVAARSRARAESPATRSARDLGSGRAVPGARSLDARWLDRGSALPPGDASNSRSTPRSAGLTELRRSLGSARFTLGAVLETPAPAGLLPALAGAGDRALAQAHRHLRGLARLHRAQGAAATRATPIELTARERRLPLLFLWPRLFRYLRHKNRRGRDRPWSQSLVVLFGVLGAAVALDARLRGSRASGADADAAQEGHAASCSGGGDFLLHWFLWAISPVERALVAGRRDPRLT